MTTYSDKMIANGYSRDICPEAFDLLADWCERGKDNEKGLLLSGDVGTGKTLFFTTFLGRCRMLTARRIVAMYSEINDPVLFADAVHGSYTDTYIRNPPRALIIDDLGEETTSVRYGERREVLTEVLTDRYDAWQRHRVKTFITTNMDSKEFVARYGARVLDRVLDMCEVVKFAGKSARRSQR